MKKIKFSFLYLSTVLFFLPSISKGQENYVSVRFNKNIELTGYLIHLADPDNNDPNHPITKELNNYPEDKQRPVLGAIFATAGNMDYGTIIRLFYSLPEFPLSETYEVQDSLLSSFGYDTPSQKEEIRKLISNVNQFSKESGFEKLWENLTAYRDSTAALADQNKPTEALLNKMEAFYQQEFNGYQIVPSLTLWAGPGWGFTDENNTATFILGPLAKNYDYSDEAYLQSFSVHEFGHSFVNSIVLNHARKVIDEMAHLYEPIQENMTRQGYGNWSSSVVEHFVRSGEIIIADQMKDDKLKEELWSDFVEEREFIYLPFIVDKLKHYRYKKEFSYEESVALTLRDFQKNHVH